MIFNCTGGGAICCSRFLQERENVGFAQPPHAVTAALLIRDSRPVSGESDGGREGGEESAAVDYGTEDDASGDEAVVATARSGGGGGEGDEPAPKRRKSAAVAR